MIQNLTLSSSSPGLYQGEWHDTLIVQATQIATHQWLTRQAPKNDLQHMKDILRMGFGRGSE